MLRYTAYRILIMVPTLIAISMVVFGIMKLPGGDYLTTYIAELQSQGESVDMAKVAFLRTEYGLDLPLWHQYLIWIGNLLQGDPGYSFQYNLPVSQVVGDRLMLTFIVSFTTILFTYIVAFPIGIYSATHQYSASDYLLTFLGFLGIATPSFLLALVLLYFANVHFGLSIGGLMDDRFIDKPWSWGKFVSVLAHLWIPVIVIGAAGTAGMIRRLRANLLDELQKQYVVTARAKGMHPVRALLKYPLRMALNPFIADIGSLLPHVISGSAIVSVVLSLPTTGPMLLDALRSRDMYLAGSFLMFLAVLTVVGVFLSDHRASRSRSPDPPRCRANTVSSASFSERARPSAVQQRRVCRNTPAEPDATVRIDGQLRSLFGRGDDPGAGAVFPGVAMDDDVVEASAPSHGRAFRRLSLAVLYLSITVSEVLAPYSLAERHVDAIYAPPQAVHLFPRRQVRRTVCLWLPVPARHGQSEAGLHAGPDRRSIASASFAAAPPMNSGVSFRRASICICPANGGALFLSGNGPARSGHAVPHHLRHADIAQHRADRHRHQFHSGNRDRRRSRVITVAGLTRSYSG